MHTLSVKEFNDFLRENSLWLSLVVVLVIAFIVAVIVLLVIAKKEKREAKPKRIIDGSAYITALGGSENIISHSLVRSRIVLELSDYDRVDKEKLKEAGVDGFIMMSNKLTLVIKGDAEKVNQAIFPDE